MTGEPYNIHIRGVAVAENALDMFAGSLMRTLAYLTTRKRKLSRYRDMAAVRIYESAIRYINRYYVDQQAGGE
ncbi:MAG: hypothetical protein SOV61_00235 [Lachnospiraceae bacterium]|nr:hypothetical protein [Lachnospiraceae bacterium]